jgi:dihydrofolate reductase
MQMRKVVAAAFVSLDGIMQAPGGPEEDKAGVFEYGGWVFPYWDATIEEFMDGMFTEPFDLLLGRKTYDIFAAHWPFVPEDDPIGPLFTGVTKYVATRSTRPLTWANSVVLGGDVAGEIAALKKGDGPMLLTQGSSDLLQTLLKYDLIDEFRVMTFPLILGKGKRLFGNGTMPAALKLTQTKSSASGVIMSVYERAGTIRTGSFAAANPSEAEMERRERAKREG